MLFPQRKILMHSAGELEFRSECRKPNELPGLVMVQGGENRGLIRLCQAFRSCLLTPTGNLLIIGSLLYEAAGKNKAERQI